MAATNIRFKKSVIDIVDETQRGQSYVSAWRSEMSQYDSMEVSRTGSTYEISMFSEGSQESTMIRMRSDGDNLLIIWGGFSGPYNAGAFLQENVVLPASTAINSPTNQNIYTNVVGETLTANFTGTSIGFKSLRENRGGVWRFSVDGAVVADVSTWSATTDATFKEQHIVGGLADGPHTISAEFIGDDPINPPSSGAGTARGWMSYFTDGRAEHPEGPFVASRRPSDTMIIPGSNVEMAVNTAFAAGDALIPRHATPGLVQVLTKKISHDVSDLDPTKTDRFRLKETYIAKENGTGDTIWTGTLWFSFSPGHIEINHEIQVVKETPVLQCYLSMFPNVADKLVRLTLMDTAVTNFPEDGSLLRYEGVIPAVEAIYDTGDVVICSIDTSVSTAGVLHISPSREVFLFNRTDGNAKVYWNANGLGQNDGVLPVGQIIKTKQTFFVGKTAPPAIDIIGL